MTSQYDEIRPQPLLDGVCTDLNYMSKQCLIATFLRRRLNRRWIYIIPRRKINFAVMTSQFDVVSMLDIRCSTSRPNFDLLSTSIWRHVPAGELSLRHYFHFTVIWASSGRFSSQYCIQFISLALGNCWRYLLLHFPRFCYVFGTVQAFTMGGAILLVTSPWLWPQIWPFT